MNLKQRVEGSLKSAGAKADRAIKSLLERLNEELGEPSEGPFCERMVVASKKVYHGSTNSGGTWLTVPYTSYEVNLTGPETSFNTVVDERVFQRLKEGDDVDVRYLATKTKRRYRLLEVKTI